MWHSDRYSHVSAGQHHAAVFGLLSDFDVLGSGSAGGSSDVGHHTVFTPYPGYSASPAMTGSPAFSACAISIRSIGCL